MSLLHSTSPNSKYMDKTGIRIADVHIVDRTSALHTPRTHAPTSPPAPSPKPSRDVPLNPCLYSHHPRKLGRHLHLAGLLVVQPKGAQAWDQLRSCYQRNQGMDEREEAPRSSDKGREERGTGGNREMGPTQNARPEQPAA